MLPSRQLHHPGFHHVIPEHLAVPRLHVRETVFSISLNVSCPLDRQQCSKREN